MDGEQKILLSTEKRTTQNIAEYVHLGAGRQRIRCIMALHMECA